LHARPIFASFTSGEMSPLLYGRVDFAKYTAGLRILQNYLLRPHGPVFNRPGTHFVCEVKDSSKFTRLIPFEFSTAQAYQIEAGDLYFRFMKDGGRIQVAITNAVSNGGPNLIRITSVAHGMSTGMRVKVESVGGVPNATGIWTITKITADTFDLQGSTFAGAYTSGGIAIPDIATPYTAADLPLLKKIQSADTAFFFHPSYAIRKLTRITHTQWVMTIANLLPPPTFEAGFSPTTTLTPSATTGLGITLTAGAAVFEDSDVGRMVTTTADFGVNGLPARAIIKTVGAGPQAACTADVVDDFASTGAIPSQSWTIQGSPVSALTPSVSQPAHMVTTLTIAARGWRSTDVGRYVRVNKGVCRIIGFTSATVVTAEILTEFNGVTASPGGSWSIEDPLWSTLRGFPRCGALHEQRLFAAGSASNPQTFWGSNVGQYEVFALGPDDDDACEFAIAANDVNVINAILPLAWLLMFTTSTEFKVKGSDGATNAAIGPNNVDVKPSTFWGSSDRVAPLRIGNAGLFVSRAGTELREMVFEIARDNYIANDLLLLAEHLTIGGGYTITDIAYQRRPNSLVWCVRNDGALLALTYQREHDVAGWSRHLTGATTTRDDGRDEDHNQLTTDIPDKGKFESVCVTPHWIGDRDVSFYIVNRTIGGATKRYIEYMDDVNGFYGRLGMDCALTYSGAATSTLTGLSHLEGETVTVLGNGAVYPTAVVTGGQITLPAGLPQVTQAEVGIGFTSVMEPMQPEVPQQGTSQGLQKIWSKVFVRLYKSMGLFVNGVEQDFRTPADAMDTRLPLFSGDKEVSNPVDLGPHGVIRIEQRDPLPQTIIAIFGPITVGEAG
jgi:hypothetical protein